MRAGDDLVVDPGVGALHTVAQGHRGLPPVLALDQCVIAVAPSNSLGGGEVVVSLELDACDVLDDVDQLVDRDQLARTEVDRIGKVTLVEHLDALDAIVHVHERAGLLAVAPDLDSSAARELGLDHLAAHRGRRLLPPTVVGPEGSVDVVEARHAGLDPEVLEIVAAHPLAEQLLPAVAVLGHGRVGIGFDERCHVRVGLLRRVVDAGRRGVEVARHPRRLSCHKEVGVDQDAQHAERLVVLDEAHAAHVGREVEDLVDAVHGALAGLLVAQVENHVLGALVELVPVLEGLHVDTADLGEAPCEQGVDEVAADESAASGDECSASGISSHGSLPYVPGGISPRPGPSTPPTGHWRPSMAPWTNRPVPGSGV
jgi:hypothetical protein